MNRYLAAALRALWGERSRWSRHLRSAVEAAGAGVLAWSAGITFGTGAALLVVGSYLVLAAQDWKP